jgi:hypothetical protein
MTALNSIEGWRADISSRSKCSNRPLAFTGEEALGEEAQTATEMSAFVTILRSNFRA